MLCPGLRCGRSDHSRLAISVSSATGRFCETQHENRSPCGTFMGPAGSLSCRRTRCFSYSFHRPSSSERPRKPCRRSLSRTIAEENSPPKPLQKSFAPPSRAKPTRRRRPSALIESQFSEEIDILDRARRFAAMNLTKDANRTGTAEERGGTSARGNHLAQRRRPRRGREGHRGGAGRRAEERGCALRARHRSRPSREDGRSAGFAEDRVLLVRRAPGPGSARQRVRGSSRTNPAFEALTAA